MINNDHGWNTDIQMIRSCAYAYRKIIVRRVKQLLYLNIKLYIFNPGRNNRSNVCIFPKINILIYFIGSCFWIPRSTEFFEDVLSCCLLDEDILLQEIMERIFFFNLVDSQMTDRRSLWWEIKSFVAWIILLQQSFVSELLMKKES